MKSFLLAVAAALAVVHTSAHMADTGTPVAVDSLGFSVVMPGSTVAASRHVLHHDGVDEWQHRHKLPSEPWRDSVRRRVVFYAEYEHPDNGAWYTVVVSVAGPLYSIPDEELELQREALADVHLSKGLDTVRYYRPVVVYGNNGRLFSYGGYYHGKGCIRGVTVLRGDTLYTLRARLPDANDTTAADAFLASLVLHSGPIPTTITTPKGTEFLRFVRTLTARQLAPVHMFYSYYFSRADIPAMYDALRTPFADEQWEQFHTMRETLIKNIVRMDSTVNIAFLCELYTTLDTQSRIRPAIINALIKTGTAESVSEAAQLLRTSTPENMMGLLALYDEGRPDLARYMLPCIPTLLGKPRWRSIALRFLVSNLAKSHITDSDLAPWRDSLTHFITAHFAAYTQWHKSRVAEHPDVYTSRDGIPDLGILLAAFLCNEPGISHALHSLAQDSSLTAYLCAAMLRCGEHDSATIYSLAANPYTRAHFYGTLQMTGTTAHFPKEFCSQQAITESMLATSYGWHGQTPEMEYIATRDYIDTAYYAFGGRFLYFKVLLPPSYVALYSYYDYNESTDNESDSEEVSDEEPDDTPRWYIVMCGPYSSAVDADEETVNRSIILPLDSPASEELFSRMFRFFLKSNQPG